MPRAERLVPPWEASEDCLKCGSVAGEKCVTTRPKHIYATAYDLSRVGSESNTQHQARFRAWMAKREEELDFK